MNAGLRGLYAITDGRTPPALLAAVEAAIRGGARVIQYRDKSGDRTRREAEARALLELCRGHGVPLIINDDVDLAMTLGADGVHLGRDDGEIGVARVRLGPRALIGASCYDSLPRAIAAAHAGADYVAFGSFFPSASKPAAVRAPLELLGQARRQLAVPVCAVGGISTENGAALVTAGADMLAVISGLFAADDVRNTAGAYSALFAEPSRPLP